MCEVAELFVGVKLKLNNSDVAVPEMPQALGPADVLPGEQHLTEQTEHQKSAEAGQEQQTNMVFPQQQQQQPFTQSLDKQVHSLALGQQGLANVPLTGDNSGSVADAATALEMPADWDPAAMGSMDWTAGYENILNLLQDEFQVLENYPDAGLF
ncbi:hypothetical protein NQ176_g8726 [Zarea fungicola]|uniref:Uncharacterized protein n=1 Tax=Zarea fungicola TaxID=93591 RepID=A0ACC1MRN1_9HYPO|nr:hypothetical protein NQ176_g8726 [Lecanicillium fungicola]